MSDIQIDGPEDLQQAVRFNLFQIRQASARVEGFGIPAKGLTGRGYEGQYFWDTEIYILPCLTHPQPHVAKRLLRWRHGMLPAAAELLRTLDKLAGQLTVTERVQIDNLRVSATATGHGRTYQVGQGSQHITER